MRGRTRFCAEEGGCDDPTCYLCTVVSRMPQPPAKRPVMEREKPLRTARVEEL